MLRDAILTAVSSRNIREIYMRHFLEDFVRPVTLMPLAY